MVTEQEVAAEILRELRIHAVMANDPVRRAVIVDRMTAGTGGVTLKQWRTVMRYVNHHFDDVPALMRSTLAATLTSREAWAETLAAAEDWTRRAAELANGPWGTPAALGRRCLPRTSCTDECKGRLVRVHWPEQGLEDRYCCEVCGMEWSMASPTMAYYHDQAPLWLGFSREVLFAEDRKCALEFLPQLREDEGK